MTSTRKAAQIRQDNLCVHAYAELKTEYNSINGAK